ncbi:MAG: ATP-binding protein [Alphaproteobacteria bacterium]|nr:ATP-binding protein [Alphaproteobacteria bacterium]
MNAEAPRVGMDGEIIPAHLAIKAMRDSGYRNTAYALAELIDNSVQAGATDVEVFCIEERQLVSERERLRISQIGVLDNGHGMPPKVLREALQFGNGSHLNDRSGIGRFGMGLPNSSISQCRRLDVWSWQSGPDNAMRTYLDVDEIEAGRLMKVPEPIHAPLPPEWRARARSLGTTGTLVLWQGFDEHRLTWRGAKSTLENTEALAGRMYRKFIGVGTVAIRLVALENDTETFGRDARVNDPLYLMTPSSTPAPFVSSSMFQPWGPDEEFLVPFGGMNHNVFVRISWARPETVPDSGTDRGHQPYGKHAAKNIGVSILRAGRELDLDPGWANGYDPVERWWGVEVEFPPALDEVFGVPNNKQAATIFSAMAQFDWESEAEAGEHYKELKDRLREEGDPRAELMDIAQYIHDQIRHVRARLKDQTKGLRSGGGRRHEDTSVEDRASTKFKERAESGYKTEQDNQVFDDEAKQSLVDDLVNRKNYPERAANEIADAVEKRGKRVIFVDAELDGYAFFKVEQRPGGITEIIFNTAHPAYDQLVLALDGELEGATDKELMERIANASDTMRMLFAAWARYEMEDVPNRGRINDMRHEWGKMARVFLTDEEG